MNRGAFHEYETLREEVLQFMIQRGWRDKIAKRRGFEQSLLEHSIICLDVMLTLLPVLRSRLNLTEEEEQALVLGTAMHDVAKERAEWQAYIAGMGEYEPHVIPEYTAEAVKALAEWLGFGGQDDARAGANLHMRSVQTAARVFAEAQNAGPRVMLLQRLVADVDNVASAKGLLAARDALARSSTLLIISFTCAGCQRPCCTEQPRQSLSSRAGCRCCSFPRARSTCALGPRSPRL